jgi:hypothetical protein
MYAQVGSLEKETALSVHVALIWRIEDIDGTTTLFEAATERDKEPEAAGTDEESLALVHTRVSAPGSSVLAPGAATEVYY